MAEKSRYPLNGNGIISRIVKLEASEEALRNEVAGVTRAVNDLAQRIENEFQRIRDSQKPNWHIWISMITLAVFLCVSIGSAAYVPVWITTKNINDKAQAALDWKSQAQPEIASLKEHQKEIETQFNSADEVRNTLFAQVHRDIEKLQNGMHDLKAPFGSGVGSPYYYPKISPHHREDQ